MVKASPRKDSKVIFSFHISSDTTYFFGRPSIGYGPLPYKQMMVGSTPTLPTFEIAEE